jgi:hypothetical protein
MQAMEIVEHARKLQEASGRFRNCPYRSKGSRFRAPSEHNRGAELAAN